MAKIYEFSVGYCTHPACMALKGAGLASRCFPSRAYLIETKVGFSLWDTGYAEHFIDATSKGIYRLYPTVTPVYFNTSDALATQLDKFGIASEDIHTLMLSHFHADHIAGLHDFPRSQILASSEGWEKVHDLHGISALYQAFLPQLIPSDIESRLNFFESYPRIALPSELAPFTQAWDVTGTGEILVVALPGHAIGHMGAFVLTEAGWTLLASDAAWANESYQELRGPSELSFIIQHNRRAYYQTLTQLHQLYQSKRVEIRLTHQAP